MGGIFFADVLQNICTEVNVKVSRKKPVANSFSSKITGCGNRDRFTNISVHCFWGRSSDEVQLISQFELCRTSDKIMKLEGPTIFWMS